MCSTGDSAVPGVWHLLQVGNALPLLRLLCNPVDSTHNLLQSSKPVLLLRGCFCTSPRFRSPLHVQRVLPEPFPKDWLLREAGRDEGLSVWREQLEHFTLSADWADWAGCQIHGSLKRDPLESHHQMTLLVCTKLTWGRSPSFFSNASRIRRFCSCCQRTKIWNKGVRVFQGVSLMFLPRWMRISLRRRAWQKDRHFFLRKKAERMFWAKPLQLQRLLGTSRMFSTARNPIEIHRTWTARPLHALDSFRRSSKSRNRGRDCPISWRKKSLLHWKVFRNDLYAMKVTSQTSSYATSQGNAHSMPGKLQLGRSRQVFMITIDIVEYFVFLCSCSCRLLLLASSSAASQVPQAIAFGRRGVSWAVGLIWAVGIRGVFL